MIRIRLDHVDHALMIYMIYNLILITLPKPYKILSIVRDFNILWRVTQFITAIGRFTDKKPPKTTTKISLCLCPMLSPTQIILSSK